MVEPVTYLKVIQIIVVPENREMGDIKGNNKKANIKNLIINYF